MLWGELKTLFYRNKLMVKKELTNKLTHLYCMSCNVSTQIFQKSRLGLIYRFGANVPYITRGRLKNKENKRRGNKNRGIKSRKLNERTLMTLW